MIWEGLYRNRRQSPGHMYDASGNRKLFTLKKSGATEINTAYTYDKMDRLKEIKENGQLTASYTYDDNGTGCLCI